MGLSTTQWGQEWGGGQVAVSHSGSTLNQVLHGRGYPGVSSGWGHSAGLQGLAPGNQVSFTFHNPFAVPVKIQPFVRGSNWVAAFAPALSVKPGTSTVTWTVPAVSGKVMDLGLQIDNFAGLGGNLALTGVTKS